jgi:hypothetical protein
MRIDMGEVKYKNDIRKAVILCLMPVVCCIVFKLLKLTDENDMKIIMRIALCSVCGYGIWELYEKRLTAEKVVFLLVVAGCILRIGYTLYTHAFVRGHDIGINNGDGNGHWAYFYHILNGNLPPNNEYQFYQPPLYYMVGAVFIRIMMAIKGANEWNGFEYIPQMVSCVCSIIVMLTTVKIMDKLNIKKTVQIIPIALLAVYPAQIMTAGRMNNDSMVQMFMVLALYATLCWHKERKMSNIIFIALAIGLGMMTKISCGIVAFVTGPVMIYHFVKAVKSKEKDEIKNLIIQFAVFVVICFPLGLWYGIRNYVEFGQPLNYVAILDQRMPIYNGNEPFVKRWITFPLFHFYEAPYTDMNNDTNIWMILIKTGVHGEFTWENLSSFLAWTLDYVHLFLMLISMAAIVFCMVKNKELDKTAKFSAFWIWALMGVSYIQFNISYPYACTPNFRYVLPAQIAASCFVAYMCQYCYVHRDKMVFRYLGNVYVTIVALFCVMSIMHFC